MSNFLNVDKTNIHLRKLLFLVLVLLPLHSVADNHKAMQVVLADYRPYSWFDGNLGAVGLEVDILKEAISRRMGIPLEVNIQPWARAQVNVEIGQADAFVAVVTEKRRAYTKISQQSIATWGVSTFSRVAHEKHLQMSIAKDVSSLSPFLLGSMIGNGWAERNLAGMNVIWQPDMPRLLRMLDAGRIEIIPDSPVVVKYYLKELGLQNEIVEINSLVSLGMHLCVGLKSDYVGMLPGFDKTIIEMRKDGTLASISATYQ